ncbi:hypothetical protein [Cupriavidus pinatubonensis]|uniref:hypothetical protein n=1 Tax=Cupriavidus pinatubonensis TaxID=248026 RepID=UPI00361BC732
MSAIAVVPCLLCGELARRWSDRHDHVLEGRIDRCARCGGRFSVTGEAYGEIIQGNWDTTELMTAVRQRIATGELPRIEGIAGRPSVIAVGRQAS